MTDIVHVEIVKLIVQILTNNAIQLLNTNLVKENEPGKINFSPNTSYAKNSKVRRLDTGGRFLNLSSLK